MGSLFISYASEDRPFVARLAAALNGGGHDVWWDEDLRAGGDYRAQIRAALEKADLTIVVWSERSRLSRFVADEADLALSLGKLLPVTLDGAEPPLGFGTIQALDLGGWSGEADSAALAKLSGEIDRRLQLGPEPRASRPPIRLARTALALGGGGGLVFGLAQVVLLTARRLAEGMTLAGGAIARFGAEHAAIAFLLLLPVATYATVRSRRLGLSRFRAAARPFQRVIAVGFVLGLGIVALALVSGAGADLPPRVRAAELASNVLVAALTAAAVLGAIGLLLGLVRRD